MSDNGYDAHIPALTADARMWDEVSQRLSSLSSSSSGLAVSEADFSFASSRGMAAAYSELVQTYAALVRGGSDVATKFSDALTQTASSYQSTDDADSSRIASSGTGLAGNR